MYEYNIKGIVLSIEKQEIIFRTKDTLRLQKGVLDRGIKIILDSCARGLFPLLDQFFEEGVDT